MDPSQTSLLKERWWGEGSWEIGVDIYTLLYIKQVINKDLFIHRALYSKLCHDLEVKRI